MATSYWEEVPDELVKDAEALKFGIASKASENREGTMNIVS